MDKKSTHKKRKHTQTLNPNKYFYLLWFLSSLSIAFVFSSHSVLFRRARERKRKRKGALYDDDVNDDDVLRDDDDDAKNRPALYATRADDASQSAPEYSGDGGGAFRR